MNMNLLSRIGTLSLCTALVCALVGCRTSTPKPASPYTGIMSSRGSIPPAYEQIQTLPRASQELPAAPETAPQGVYSGIGEGNAFVAPSPELENQVEVVEVESPLPPMEAPAATAAEEEPVKWTLPPVPQGEAPKAEAAGTLTYVVRGGDSLSRIAVAHGVKTADLLAANPQLSSPDKIQVGQTLTLPAGAKSPAASSASPAPSTSGKKAIAREAIPEDGKYTVRSGDSLWLIARRFGVKTADLLRWNNLSSDKLKVGQVLVLKGAAAPAAPATPAAPAAPVAAPVEETAPAAPVEPAEVGIVPETTEEVPQWTSISHAVNDGDTLSGIANIYEITVEALLQSNPQVKSDADLKPGMIVQVPSKL
ncbi:MAG: LysM peptidoglycan-binding domain-containing protein [Oligosphaeraceae bacterium]